MRKYLLPLCGLVVLTGCMNHRYPGDEKYYNTAPLQPTTYYSNARPTIPSTPVSSRHPDIRSSGYKPLIAKEDGTRDATHA
ncbi:MAG TPA: hypothetical protein VGV92_08710 [Gammaproteobacteria bacterium]|nr:hypothetical protein [Gammaproteobacteria bacterium]